MPGFSSLSLEVFLLIASSLLIFSVLASKISSFFGLPSLLLFLAVGMLAGSEGPGGIEFTNYSLAFAIGSVSLAFIIFDGGLRTSWKSIKPVLGLGASLSTIAVAVTAASTSAFAVFALGFSWLEGLLLGAIVSSTDAAAVFSILRSRNLALKGKLKQTLEFEAGSNDPMAIFLTLAVVALLTAQVTSPIGLGLLFIFQAGLGILFGFFGGKGIRWLINHVGIEFEGLYSVLLFALVMLLFSGTAAAGGSGFLAVYIAGLVLGNSDFLHKGTLLRFHDGIAWIAQISVFLALGLLVFPTHLAPIWKEGILLALFLMFVARPLSVFIAAPFTNKFSKKERLFISWVGLRGAAPIILATVPWSANLPNAEHYFNLIFFVVLISVAMQGMSIPWLAKKLNLSRPHQAEPAHDIAVGMLPAGFVSVELEVYGGSAAEGRRIIDLALPSGVLLISLERNERFLIPKGDTSFFLGDKAWGLARPSNIDALKTIFGSAKIVS